MGIFVGIATLDASSEIADLSSHINNNLSNLSSQIKNAGFANASCLQAVPNCFSCDPIQPGRCFACYGLRFASNDAKQECYTPAWIYVVLILPIVIFFVCIALVVACCVGGLACCGMGIKKATQKPQYNAGAIMAAPVQGQQPAPGYAQPATGYVQPAAGVAERPPNYGNGV